MIETLTGKRILLISPQSWGKMFVSKHHYAVALARAGNQVYFLNPPDPSVKGIREERPGAYPGLILIHHSLPFPYILKFHWFAAYKWLMRFHIRKILHVIGEVPELVWSFDIGNLYPFSLFPASAKKVFHPVDEPLNQTALNAGKGADIVLSVTKEIIEKYSFLQRPSFLVNHGVTETFFSEQTESTNKTGNLNVGFSGNMLRLDIDRPILLKIIQEHPGICFHCYGSWQRKEANLSGNDDEGTRTFIEYLQHLPNVILHGVITGNQLAAEYHKMDAFLICYDILKDQSKGTNYHKIMEYLATGKVVISNNVTAYQGRQDLVIMPTERRHNDGLPALFAGVIAHLENWNAPERKEVRKEFAWENRYCKQLERISSYLHEIKN